MKIALFDGLKSRAVHRQLSNTLSENNYTNIGIGDFDILLYVTKDWRQALNTGSTCEIRDCHATYLQGVVLHSPSKVLLRSLCSCWRSLDYPLHVHILLSLTSSLAPVRSNQVSMSSGMYCTFIHKETPIYYLHSRRCDTCTSCIPCTHAVGLHWCLCHSSHFNVLQKCQSTLYMEELLLDVDHFVVLLLVTVSTACRAVKVECTHTHSWLFTQLLRWLSNWTWAQLWTLLVSIVARLWVPANVKITKFSHAARWSACTGPPLRHSVSSCMCVFETASF